MHRFALPLMGALGHLMAKPAQWLRRAAVRLLRQPSPLCCNRQPVRSALGRREGWADPSGGSAAETNPAKLSPKTPTKEVG